MPTNRFSRRMSNHFHPRFQPGGAVKVTMKSWGYELTITNNEHYCQKILVFRAAMGGSLHFHRHKHETWYVLEGTGYVDLPAKRNGKMTARRLGVGSVVSLPPCQAHRLVNDSAGWLVIMEASTPHRDDDTYRVGPTVVSGHGLLELDRARPRGRKAMRGVLGRLRAT